MEAFQAHPQIGNISTLKKKFAITKEKQHSLEQFSRWSDEEQAQVRCKRKSFARISGV